MPPRVQEAKQIINYRKGLVTIDRAFLIIYLHLTAVIRGAKPEDRHI
jgi:hypothetical protein